MQQALHILVKDVRYLWRETCLFIAIVALFAWKDYAWTQGFVAVTAIYVIVRLIQAEPIPGDTQFWITRPYRRISLITAKLLFILIVINLPIFVARIILLAGDGFPLAFEAIPLLWSQFLIFIGICMPVAGLAAITADILPFIFSIIVLMVVGFFMQTPLNNQFEAWSEGIEWIRGSMVVGIVVIAGVCVLGLQYSSRRTFLSRAVAGGLLVIALLGYTRMPSTLAMDLQTWISSKAPFPVRVTVDNTPRKFAIGKRDTVQVSIPLNIGTIPADVDMQADGLAVTLEGSDGSIFKAFSRPVKAANTSGVSIDAIVFVAGSFFEAERSTPVRLRGSLYMTAFGNAHSTTITVGVTPVNAGDGLQCHVDPVSGRLQCCSAFRWPRLLVYARVRNDRESIWPFISYSPFPSGMDLNYIEDHGASGPPPHAPQVTITALKPLSHFRSDFFVENFDMSNFVAPGR